jgi:type IV pilus assembly protein PilM
MIKDVFIPEKIGSYYVISKRIVGIDIGTTHISATIIRMNGSQVTIEQCIQHALIPGSPTQYTERVQETLRTLSAQLPKCDEVRTCLSSSSVIFKKLKLPFITEEKIKLVIYYEIEPLLPFSIDDAIVDFIITNVHQEEQTAEVLAAAVRKKDVQDHLALFENTGIQPNIVGIDMFSLYGLYTQINKNNPKKESIILIDLGSHETSIMYIYKEKLQSIRVFAKGLVDIAKKISLSTKLPLPEVMEYIIRFGIKNENSHDLVSSELVNALKAFWAEIQFTINLFKSQLADTKNIEHIIILGGGSQIQGLSEFVSLVLHIPCSLMQLNALFNNTTLLSKKTSDLAQGCIMSTSIAFPHALTEKVNLRQKEFDLHDTAIVYKQIITASVLLIAIVFVLLLNTFWQVKTLKHELHASENEVIAVLREQFPQLPKDENDIEDVINNAQKQLVEEEKVWFAFSSRSRSSVLAYLLELFTRIDKKSLGLHVDQITIQSNILTLKATVADHQALKLFERDLRESPLFEHVEGQEDLSFTMKIRLASIHKDRS